MSFGARNIAQFLLLAGALTLGACSIWEQGEQKFPERRKGDDSFHYGNEKKPGLFGPGGISFGDKKKGTGEEGGGGIGVNSYLWRASLDTIAFMPLSSADPFGGVIITDWFSPPESPAERFKINLFILDRALRADGLKVAVFRQLRAPNGDWADAQVEGKVNTDIENAILTRARQMRTESAEAK